MGFLDCVSYPLAFCEHNVRWMCIDGLWIVVDGSFDERDDVQLGAGSDLSCIMPHACSIVPV